MHTSFLCPSLRSQLLCSCCGRIHLEPIGACWRSGTGPRKAERCTVDLPVAVVGRVPGTVIWCTKENKNHIARDFHSFTVQQVTDLYFRCGIPLFFLLGASAFSCHDPTCSECCHGVKEINSSEARWILWPTFSVKCWICNCKGTF